VPSLQTPRPPTASHGAGAFIVTLLLALTATACSAGTANPSVPPRAVGAGPAGRVVAIGDLHADVGAALDTLRLAGLVDAHGDWSGGHATLVQTGDLMDRGPRSLGLVKLMRSLSDQAAAAGGRVICLLGNHEAMNLRGDWRYVSPADVAEFGGVKARQAALLPAGDVGAWLRGRDSAVQIDNVVFVHGGLRPQWAAMGVDAISNGVRSALLRQSSPTILGEEGPLWYRGYLLEPEPLACAELSQALTALGARRMVVGHTTQDSGKIISRCGGQLLGIDTGISTYYGRHIAALDLVDGDARALYPSGPEDLPDP